MKKYLLLVLTCMLVMFSFTTNVFAVKIKDIACNYDLKFRDNGGELHSVGKFQIVLTEYNDGETKRPGYSYFYAKSNEKLTGKKANEMDPYEYDNADKFADFMLVSNLGGSKAVADAFRDSNGCPIIYGNNLINNNTLTLTFYPASPDDKYSYNANSSTSSLYKGPNDTSWQDPNKKDPAADECSTNFTKQECTNRKHPWDDANNCCLKNQTIGEDPTTPTPTDGFECDYTMDLDLYDNSEISLKYKKSYNAIASSYKYEVIVAGNVYTVNSPFNEDVLATTPMAMSNNTMKINASTIKKVFESNGNCPSKDSMYHYLNAATGQYEVTDDKIKADEESTAGRVGTGNEEGESPGYSGDLNIMFGDPDPIKGGYENCKDLLGNSLSTLIKTIRILLQVAGCAICLINGMLSFTSAIATKDPQALAKAGRKLAIMLCILAAIILLPTLIRVLVRLVGGYDLSCI